VTDVRVEHAVLVDAPVERVFALYADPALLPEWRRAIQRVEHDEPLDRSGARLRVFWRSRFEATDAELVRFEPPHLHEVAATSRAPYVATATFRAVAPTRTEMRLALRVGVPWPLGLLLRVRLTNELDAELERFRSFVEEREERA
jgi:uncharacterized protein YndB with AHSA1/START domain